MKTTDFTSLYIAQINEKAYFCRIINKIYMTNEQPITLQEGAMRFGAFMGVFWIIKFSFLPLGFTMPLLQLLFILLTLFVPVLGVIYARRFRNKYCDGIITFGRAYIFTFLLYLFAALLAAVGHYIYFRYIDNGFLSGMYLEQLESLKSSVKGDMVLSIDQLIEAFNTISSLSPLTLTFQLIYQNLFYGMLLALPTALLVMKRKKNI